MIRETAPRGAMSSAVVTRSPAVWKEWPEPGRELGLIVSELTDLPPSLAEETEGFLTRLRCGPV